MRYLPKRFGSISLLWKILFPLFICVAAAITLVQVWTVQHTTGLIEQRLTQSLDANLAVLQGELDQLGDRWHRAGDQLLIGDTPLNGRADIVDRVAHIAGGVATIFAGDMRIATTIRKDDGTPAVGTTLAPGPARSAVLDHGETYRGPAVILGKDYLTIYQPVKDAAGTVAGILFVGLPTAATNAAIAASARTTVAISVVVLVAMGLTVGLLLHRVLSPLTVMTQAMHQLAAGDLTVEVPPSRHDDEIGRLEAAMTIFKQQAVENAHLARDQSEQREKANHDKTAALNAMADRIEIGNQRLGCAGFTRNRADGRDRRTVGGLGRKSWRGRAFSQPVRRCGAGGDRDRCLGLRAACSLDTRDCQSC